MCSNKNSWFFKRNTALSVAVFCYPVRLIAQLITYSNDVIQDLTLFSFAQSLNLPL